MFAQRVVDDNSDHENSGLNAQAASDEKALEASEYEAEGLMDEETYPDEDEYPQSEPGYGGSQYESDVNEADSPGEIDDYGDAVLFGAMRVESLRNDGVGQWEEIRDKSSHMATVEDDEEAELEKHISDPDSSDCYSTRLGLRCLLHHFRFRFHFYCLLALSARCVLRLRFLVARVGPSVGFFVLVFFFLIRPSNSNHAPSLGAVAESLFHTKLREVECIEPAYEEAKKRPDWSKWKEEIKSEIKSLNRNVPG
ncbi:hypothetical protein C2E23DRAFT_888560 [Lenzites betulinus]|nr:hypothetical protein C2E23DRAFT_888560 [Lenzites betulinus]